jgi:tetratricopeptide (TPR) repeat protein
MGINKKTYKSIAGKKLIENYKVAFFKYLGISILTLGSFTLAFIGIYNSYAETKIAIFSVEFIIIGLIILIICLGYSIYKVISRLQEEPLKIDISELTSIDGSDLSDEIENTIKKLHSNNKHSDVVRICSNLSRPLWISGKYNQRITIGAFYEDSASRLNKIEHQVSALIDDIGWTNAVIGKVKKANENINLGISIAKDNNENYLASKGYRHLGTIELRYLADTKKSIKFFEDSLNFANKINSALKKNEMIAGIKYNMSETYLEANDIDNSIKLVDEAKVLFEDLEDEERLLKVQSQKGRICLAQNTSEKNNEAKNIFNKTLTKARELSRPDEIGKCLLGLGEIHLRNGNKQLAINVLEEAISVFNTINEIREIKRANELLGIAKSDIEL